jgi:ferredoxin
MIRKIVKIDRDKCNGCGACASACQEGAIRMVGGKAAVTREDYCDGLGNCLPACPTGAITIEEREAVPFDENAVKAAMAAKEDDDKAKASPAVKAPGPMAGHCGCPGSMAKTLSRAPAFPHAGCPGSMARTIPHGSSQQSSATSPTCAASTGSGMSAPSALSQWPVQIRLVPLNAPYFAGANLLIAADCTAYAYAAFHRDYIAGRVTLIGCPKLDEGDYSEKLTQIIKENDICSVTVVRMEVPCCGGLEKAARNALTNCGKCIPWQVVTIGLDGRITDSRP